MDPTTDMPYRHFEHDHDIVRSFQRDARSAARPNHPNIVEVYGLARRRRRWRLLADQRGMTTIEYLILACLIAVVCFAVWKQLGQTIEYKTKGASRQVSHLPTVSEP